MFYPRKTDITGAEGMYIPPSILNDLRRRAAAALEDERVHSYLRPGTSFMKTDHSYPVTELDMTYNVANRLARRFYERHGALKIDPAYECVQGAPESPVMKTKLCIKYESGCCPLYHGNESLNMPLYIDDGKNRYMLVFNCAECIMLIYPAGRV